MALTLEQQAHFLYLESRWPIVIVLENNAMYGAESEMDGQRLLLCERDWLKQEVCHGR